MERLESKLFDAAKAASVSLLQELLNEDPLILDRFEVNYFSETPLHVAAILGHTDFVKEIMSIKPELANELNFHQSSPLHLASAKGHIDVVRAILMVDSSTCLVRDKNGLTPLHSAAIKGQIEVMRLLLHAKPDAARVLVYGGENILHLCVKHYQLEALKLLVNSVGDDPEFVNSKDSDGNTVLHLAVADKQVETIKFLLTVTVLEANVSNFKGMTAADVLIQSRRDMRDLEIEESLKRAGAFVTLKADIPQLINLNLEKNSLIGQDDWHDKQRSALMVVASLIATMAFQLAVSPPSRASQGGKLVDSKGNPPSSDPTHPTHLAGSPTMARNYTRKYSQCIFFNTISFFASLSIILFLMNGLPIRRRFLMWILILITWIAIISIAVTYMLSIEAEIASNLSKWLVLMAILLIYGHAIPLILKVFKKLRRRYLGGEGRD